MKKIILVFMVLLAVFLIRGGFNRSAYIFSPLELDKTATRQNYFGDLGKIYRNRFGVYFFKNIFPKTAKFETVFYNSLDSFYIFIPLYGLLFYWGVKKQNEK